MSHYKPYSSYKESGVDWLGDVPEGWAVKPLFSLYRRTKRAGFSDEELLSVYRDYGVIKKSSRDDNNNRPSEDLSNYQLVEPRDLVTNKMKTWQGSIAVSELRGIVSPAYFVYSAEHKANDRYLHHLLRCDRYISGYLSSSKGIRVNQWDLDQDLFRRFPVVLPTNDEQQAIAAFLDHETVRIDALIEKKQRQIELLEEKRQAIITQAVTKGLDPDVEMKGSSVEWLGEVPKHWGLSRVKHVCLVKGRIGFRGYTTDDIVDEGDGALTLSPSNIKGDSLVLRNCTYISWEKYNESPEIMVSEGDVMLVKTGSTYGKCARIPTLAEPATINPQMALLKNCKFNSKFLAYILNSTYLKAIISLSNTGSGMPTMTQESINNFPLPLPDDVEIKRIVESLDKSTQTINAIAEKVNNSIDLLNERRLALITAAVTGLIDVRGE